MKEAFFEEMTYCGKDKAYLPQGFRLTQEYLWYDKLVNKSDGDTEVRNIKISSPIKVTAITCDADGSNYGRLLEWDDTYGNCRKWAMPMEMLSGSGEELRRVLLVNGLSYINISGQARAHLMEYISLCRPEKKSLASIKRAGMATCMSCRMKWLEQGQIPLFCKPPVFKVKILGWQALARSGESILANIA